MGKMDGVIRSRTHGQKQHLGSRTYNTTGNKDKSLKGDMEEATAMKKANSVLYMALGMAARKTISDKFPTVNIARITLEDLIKHVKTVLKNQKMKHWIDLNS